MYHLNLAKLFNFALFLPRINEAIILFLRILIVMSGVGIGIDLVHLLTLHQIWLIENGASSARQSEQIIFCQ
jgi:hypothetical protein